MKIVVIGEGKIGKTIVEHLSREGHDITIIDNDPKVVEQMVNQYDIMGMCGNGARYDIQRSARVDKADIIIAATSQDEINILSCFIAHQLGASSTIARVRSFDYDNQIELMKKDLGISMTINPERETAVEIKNILNFPVALRVDSFTNGMVDLVEIYIPDDCSVIGESLYSVQSKYQEKVLVCAVLRGEEVFIPDGSFKFKAKDRVHLTGSRISILNFLNKIGLIESRIKNVLIVGGGKISLYLASMLLKEKYEVKIIEKDIDRCNELSELIKDATIIHGDGTDQVLLEEEGINDMDSVVNLTGSDEVNIIISMYAYKMNIHKIVAKVNTPSFAKLLESVKVASVISPKDVTSSRIISYVRAFDNQHGSNIVRLYKLVNNQIEAVEFVASPSSIVLNIPLKELKTKKNILIASIIRNNEVIIPFGNDIILPGDSVIIVTNGIFLDDLNDILE